MKVIDPLIVEKQINRFFLTAAPLEYPLFHSYNHRHYTHFRQFVVQNLEYVSQKNQENYVPE